MFRRFLRKSGFFSVFLVVGGLALAPRVAWAQDVPGFITSLTTWITENLIPLLGNLLVALVAILIKISQYSDFVNSLAVVNGWVIVRDVANMFFIIVLLIIAFGTILGQEEYHYKKLLPKLLIMAVLVNFSRTIVGVMVDAAQVVMLTFVNGYSAAAGGNFANIFQINQLLTLSQENCLGQPGGVGTNEVAIGALLALALVVVSLITVAVIVAVLALRVVMLWILTILSPIAFLTGTFPQGQKYYQQWWEEFKNQTVVGPMLAFFLWLSLATLGSGEVVKEFTDGGALTPTGESDFPNVACTGAGGGDVLFSYIISIMMLLAGVQMAQQMGGMISGIASRAKGAATRALKLGAKALAAPVAFGAGIGLKRLERGVLDFSTKPGGGALRRAVKYATPTAWKGFLKRGDVLLEESRKVAGSVAEEEANALFTRGKRRLPLREAAEHGIVAQYGKDFSFLSKEVAMARAVELETLGGTEGERARAAMISVAAHGGWLDDLARMPVFRQKLVELGRNKYGYTDGTFYNKNLLQDFLIDYLSGAGVGSGKGMERAKKDADRYQFQLQMMTALEEPGKQTKHWEYLGHARFNPKTRKYEMADEEWLTQYEAEEFGKLGDRDRTGAAPHVFQTLRQVPNKGGKIDEEDSVDTYGTLGHTEKTMIGHMSKSAAKEPTRVQRRVPAWMLGQEIYEKADEKGISQILGGDHEKAKKMAAYVKKFNEEVDSDYVFAMYSALTNQRMEDAIKGQQFNIVDKDGTFVDTIQYKGTIKPQKEEGGGGAGGGGEGGGRPPRGGGGGGGGGGAPAASPLRPPPPPPPVQQAIKGSAVIQTTIKPQLAGLDFSRPGFVENQPLFRDIRKLIKDLRGEITGLEKSVGVEFGELSKKLGKLDTVLPSESASVGEIRSAMSSAGLSEDDLRQDLQDVLGDISK